MKASSRQSSIYIARPHSWTVPAAALLFASLCPMAASAAYVLNDVEVCTPVTGCETRMGEGEKIEIERNERQRNELSMLSGAGKASVEVDYGRVKGVLGVKVSGKGKQFSVGATGMFSGRFNDVILVASDSLPVGTPVEVVVSHRVAAEIHETGVTTLPSGDGVGADLRLVTGIVLSVYRAGKQLSSQIRTWCTDNSSYQPPVSCTDSFDEHQGLRTSWTVQTQVGDTLDLSGQLSGTAFAAQNTGEDASKPVALEGFAAIAGSRRAALSWVTLRTSLPEVRLDGESGKRW
jgi:hypothetical protein